MMRGRGALAVGACLVLAPLLNLAGDVIAPPYGDSIAGHLAGIAARPQAHAGSVALWLASMTAAVPAVIGLGALAGGRGVLAARLGRGMALTGLGALTVLTAYELKLSWLVSESSPVASRAVESVMTGGSFAALEVLAQLWFLGLLALALALRTAQVGPRAVPWLVVAGAVGGLVAFGGAPRALGLAASAALVAGLGSLGVELLRGRIRLPSRAGARF